MQPDLEELFDTIRRLARARAEWSAGESLYEQELVAPRRVLEDELACAVIPSPGEAPIEVSLYPIDEEWDCECDNPSDICEHVVAVMMAWQDGGASAMPTERELLARHPVRPKPKPEPRVVEEPAPARAARRQTSTSSTSSASSARAAERSGATRRRPEPVIHRRPPPPPPKRQPGPVGYRFVATDHGLTLRRVAVFEDGEVPIARRLSGDDAEEHPPVATTPADLVVQDALDDPLEGVFGRGRIAALFGALADCEDVTFRGQAIALGGPPAKMAAVVEDLDDGRFRLGATRQPALEAEYANGLGLLAGALVPLAEPADLSVHELHQLTKGHVFDETEVWRLVVEILPDLEGKLPIIVRSQRLPKPVLSEPRAVVYVTVEGATLRAEGLVVYGDPVLAKIVRNRLVMVSAAQVPIREVDEELPLANALRRDLGLVPGHPREFTGPQAAAFARRLQDWEEGDVIGAGWERLLDGDDDDDD